MGERDGVEGMLCVYKNQSGPVPFSEPDTPLGPDQPGPKLERGPGHGTAIDIANILEHLQTFRVNHLGPISATPTNMGHHKCTYY